MARVFGAYDRKERRYVVLKFLPPALANDEQARKDLINEAKLASKVRGKNVLQVYGAFRVRSTGEVFIVMEWVRGYDLATLIRRHGPFTWGEARQILEQILSGLELIHAANIIHRDIKPQNILIRHDGTVLVADFGISKSIRSSMTRISQDTSISGTPSYMAPEAIKGEKIGRATDIYAVGCIAYEMLTGHPPFTGNPMTIMWKHVHEEPDYSVLPEEAANWIRICLEKDIEKRPNSVRQVKAALRNVQKSSSLLTQKISHNTVVPSSSGQNITGSPSTFTPPSRQNSHKIYLLLSLLCILVILMILNIEYSLKLEYMGYLNFGNYLTLVLLIFVFVVLSIIIFFPRSKAVSRIVSRITLKQQTMNADGGFSVNAKKAQEESELFEKQSPRKIVVATDGSGDYRSIQAAIDAAQAKDTIFIKAGIYKEAISITNKENINIMGSGMKQVIIDNYITIGNCKICIIEGLSINGLVKLINSSLTVRNCEIVRGIWASGEKSISN
ncbi:MAG: pectinesterase family protein [Candidatus Helarchaeota archaeon]